MTRIFETPSPAYPAADLQGLVVERLATYSERRPEDAALWALLDETDKKRVHDLEFTYSSSILYRVKDVVVDERIYTCPEISERLIVVYTVVEEGRVLMSSERCVPPVMRAFVHGMALAANSPVNIERYFIDVCETP